MRDAAVSGNVQGKLKHAGEKVFPLLLSLSFDFNLRMRGHHHRAGLRNTRPQRWRLSAAHHNIDSVIEHFGCGRHNNLEHKQANRFSGRIWPHYQLW
jgi:hypothetical protein